jgi:hypothetical protein
MQTYKNNKSVMNKINQLPSQNNHDDCFIMPTGKRISQALRSTYPVASRMPIRETRKQATKSVATSNKENFKI